MRLLANENVSGPVVAALRAAGHDVLWVKERMAGAKDCDVLARAQADARLVVTFDKDFGELAVRSGLPSSSGVVLLRLHGASPDVDNARAVAALTGRDDWAGHFAVVTDDRVRLRPLPRRSWAGELPLHRCAVEMRTRRHRRAGRCAEADPMDAGR